jgi:hypothetical protein
MFRMSPISSTIVVHGAVGDSRRWWPIALLPPKYFFAKAVLTMGHCWMPCSVVIRESPSPNKWYPQRRKILLCNNSRFSQFDYFRLDILIYVSSGSLRRCGAHWGQPRISRLCFPQAQKELLSMPLTDVQARNAKRGRLRKVNGLAINDGSYALDSS